MKEWVSGIPENIAEKRGKTVQNRSVKKDWFLWFVYFSCATAWAYGGERVRLIGGKSLQIMAILWRPTTKNKVKQIENAESKSGTVQDLINQGYKGCEICNPR